MSAAQELEQLALKYANDAIRLDKQGSRSVALDKYQRAVEILLKLCSLYPQAPQNNVYMQRVEAYRNRIKQLQDKSHSSTSESAGQQKVEVGLIKDKPHVKWSDIANLKDAKRAIQESIIYPAKRPDLFPLGWPKGILLFGPPGCGKTLMAAAVANEINATFFCIDAATIMSKWLGESEKNVVAVFNEARSSSHNGSPAIIFIDEIDSLISIRSEEVGGETRTRNQFLKEMDSISDKNSNHYLYVVGATNKPWALDEPFIRRFQKRILIPLPDTSAREEMFKIYSRDLKLTPDVDMQYLVKMTDGYTGSDIRDIFQSVQIKVVREFFESPRAEDKQAQPRAISMGDFLTVLEERKASVSIEMLKAYDRWFQEFKAL